MVSLWGSKKGDDPEGAAQNGESGGQHVVQPRVSEADERTRLLPPPSQEGYLSPDDPAVSPSSLVLSNDLKSSIQQNLEFSWQYSR
jgi:hypothetical protein